MGGADGLRSAGGPGALELFLSRSSGGGGDSRVRSWLAWLAIRRKLWDSKLASRGAARHGPACPICPLGFVRPRARDTARRSQVAK